MCNCKNIEIGTHDNQVVLTPPSWSNKEAICVDACLKDEILYLWVKGVRTGGCCCGHNKINGSIDVYEESSQLMKDLGYEVQFNPCYPDSEWSFYPKTVARVDSHIESLYMLNKEIELYLDRRKRMSYKRPLRAKQILKIWETR